CGRQTDALAVYRATRSLLADELGLEPGPPLKQLERAILRQEHELDPPAAARASPAPRPLAPRPRASHQLRPAKRGRWAPIAAVALVGALAALLTLTRGGSASVPLPGDGLAMLSPATGHMVGSIDLPAPPTALMSGFGSLWVTHADADAVSRIDLAHRSV